MCKGLPGSGKSTWAAQQFADDTTVAIVNKDTIRRELEETGWTWSPENEKTVEKVRDVRIKTALRLGFTVISDDTNFARKHKVRLEQLARETGATMETKVFDVPVEECIARNAAREGKARVPDKVIWDMWTKYLQPQAEFKVTPYVPMVGTPQAIICDLDGTLSMFKEKGHRGPYDASKCDQDDVNLPVLAILQAMERQGYKIIFLSGREDVYRDQTETFLAMAGFVGYPLFMRKAKDFRKDWIVKAELFDANVRGKWDVLFVLDDRNQVVNMWREMGLTCLQVADGNF